MPALSRHERESLEGKLTLKEYLDTLKTFSNGKSPGEDGFTAEFYKYFLDLIGQDLLDSLNAAYDAGEISISQRTAQITLIPKEDSCLLEMSN